MLLEELLKEEKAEGKAEFILDMLSDFGEEIPQALHDRILSEKDPEILNAYRKKASASHSVAEFIKLLEE